MANETNNEEELEEVINSETEEQKDMVPKQDYDELDDRFKRILAEFENFKKRSGSNQYMSCKFILLQYWRRNRLSSRFTKRFRKNMERDAINGWIYKKRNYYGTLPESKK